MQAGVSVMATVMLVAGVNDAPLLKRKNMCIHHDCRPMMAANLFI